MSNDPIIWKKINKLDRGEMIKILADLNLFFDDYDTTESIKELLYECVEDHEIILPD